MADTEAKEGETEQQRLRRIANSLDDTAWKEADVATIRREMHNARGLALRLLEKKEMINLEKFECIYPVLAGYPTLLKFATDPSKDLRLCEALLDQLVRVQEVGTKEFYSSTTAGMFARMQQLQQEREAKK